MKLFKEKIFLFYEFSLYIMIFNIIVVIIIGLCFGGLLSIIFFFI